MAKRAPLDEKPFRPLDVSILSAVVQHAPEARGAEVEPLRQIIELPESTTSLRLALPVAATPVASTVPTMPRLDQEKRILFTREESQALDRLINNLAVQVRAQVKASVAKQTELQFRICDANRIRTANTEFRLGKFRSILDLKNPSRSLLRFRALLRR